MRTLDMVEIEMVAGGVRASIGVRPVTASIHHAHAHKKVHHAKTKTALHKLVKVQPADDGDGTPISEGGGEGDGGEGDGGEGDGGEGDGGEGGVGGEGGGPVEGGDGAYAGGSGGYDDDGTASNPEVAIGYRAVSGGTEVYVANASGGTAVIVGTNGNLESTLPGECSIGTLTSAIESGAVGGAIFGAGAGVETGPGAVITGLAGAILGAGVGASSASIGCAVALWRQGK